jgi:tetratricopeptide (TPR) repeat protein
MARQQHITRRRDPRLSSAPLIIQKAKQYVQQKQEAQALELLKENFKGNERNVEYLLMLGSIAVKGASQRWAAQGLARKYTEPALLLRPQDPKARYWAAAARRLDGDIEGAIELYRSLIDSGDAEGTGLTVYSAMAEALRYLGRAEEAFELLASRYAPDAPVGIRWIYGEAAYRVGKMDEAESALRSVVEDPKTTLENRRGAWFSLAALFGKQRRYDEAMEAVQHGHRMEQFGFNREKFDKFVSRGLELFADQSLTLPTSGIQSDRPIFVVGMPRSGTTLLEQILDMHPQVIGAGELSFISHCANNLEQRRFTASDMMLTKPRNLTQPKLEKEAKYYLEMIAKTDRSARHVVDKMPGNFLHLGLISLMFPKAHVLHISRDPRDNAVSYHMLNFQGQHPQAASLPTLGYYYNQYRKIVEHWKSVLDLKIMDVKYEHLVVDNENQVRRVLDFLDLPFDEACLRSHESQRTAMTASFEQVRQPIYTGSIGRWRRYEEHLKPFIDEVEPKYLAEWDEDDLLRSALSAA